MNIISRSMVASWLVALLSYGCNSSLKVLSNSGRVNPASEEPGRDGTVSGDDGSATDTSGDGDGDSGGDDAPTDGNDEAPTFNGLTLDPDISGAVVTSDARANAEPLVGAIDASGFDNVGYAVVPAGTDCAQVTTYGSAPLASDPALSTDGSYKICVKLEKAGHPPVYGESTAFTVDTTPDIADISGAPTGTVSNPIISIPVNDVAEYKYKVGIAGSTDCADPTGYSAATPGTTPITGDLTSIASNNIRLCAVGADANGNWQPYASASTANWALGAVGPVAPATFTARVGSNIANLKWSASTGAIGYLVIRRIGTAPTWAPVNGVSYTAYSWADAGNHYVSYKGTALKASAATTGNVLTYFQVYAYDASNNYSAVPRAATVTVKTSPSLVGSFGGTSSAIAVDGTKAYVGKGKRGIFIFDISTSTPTYSGSFDFVENDRSVIDMIASGSHVYVQVWDKFYILDVSNPANPTVVRTVVTNGSATSLAIKGNYVFVGQVTGFHVIDVSTPSTASIVGGGATAASVTDLAVDGNVLVVGMSSSTAGMEIWDVTTPSAPTSSGTFGSGTSVTTVALKGNLAIAAAATDDRRVVDVSTPAAPVQRSTLPNPTSSFVESILMVGNHAYILDGGTIDAWDLTDPSNPVDGGGSPTNEYGISDMATDGTRLIYPSYSNGLRLLSLADPDVPTLVGSSGVGDVMKDIATSGNYTYIASGESGLLVLNTSNQAAPAYVTVVTTTTSIDKIKVVGSYLYAAAGSNGLEIYDLSNPASPSLTGSYVTFSNPRDLAVRSGHAYVLNGNYVTVIDVSTPALPAFVRNITFTFGTIAVASTAGAIYVAENGTALKVFSLTDPSNPALTTTLTNDFKDANALEILGSKIFSAGSPRGAVGDLSNPLAPAFLGSRNQINNDVTPLNAEYVISGSNIFDVYDPTDIVIAGNIVSDSFGRGILVGDKVYTIGNGFRIFANMPGL